MREAIDSRFITDLTIDDEVVALLKPENEDEIRVTAQVEHSTQPFTYPQAGSTGRDWHNRYGRLRSGGVVEAVTTVNEVAGRLWHQELNRQDKYGRLAMYLAFGEWEHASLTMQQLYGQPTTADFNEAVGEVRHQAEEVLVGQETHVALVVEAAEGVMNKLGTLRELPITLPRPLPDLTLMEALRDWYQPIMEPLWQQAERLDLPDECGAPEISTLFVHLLADSGLAVELTSEVTAIIFEPSKQRVAIPLKRKMSRRKLLETILPHEWVHIKRYLNGLLTGVSLAAYGLPGYLPFEEGLATAVASVMGVKNLTEAVTSYARPEAMVSIGLAAGLAPDGPWQYWDIYDLFYWHYKLESLLLQKGELDGAKAHEKADHQASTRLIRTFRGTPGPELTAPIALGLYCPRDLSYRHGNVLFWEWAAANTDLFPLLLSAKANLADPLHRAFVLSGQ